MTIVLSEDQIATLQDLAESDKELSARTRQNQEIRNRLFSRIVTSAGKTTGNWAFDGKQLSNGENE